MYLLLKGVVPMVNSALFIGNPSVANVFLGFETLPSLKAGLIANKKSGTLEKAPLLVVRVLFIQSILKVLKLLRQSLGKPIAETLEVSFDAGELYFLPRFLIHFEKDGHVFGRYVEA